MEIVYKKIVIENAEKKQTIYSYLKKNGYSENFAKNLRKQYGFIKLNNKIYFSNEIVNNGDLLEICDNPNVKSSIMPCDIELDIIYEDEDLLIINKPSNLSSMPNRSHYSNNLAGAIMKYMTQKSDNFVVRITNRLDKETAGIVIVTKNSLASNFLNEKEKTKKIYYAICDGNLEKDTIIDSNIVTTINELGYNNNKREVSKTDGKCAKTYVHIVKNYKNCFLAEISLEYGRTHQIRVHLSSVNHALVGDKLYGNPSDLISHTALVCKKVRLIHPTTKEIMDFEVDFPQDFKNLMELD